MHISPTPMTVITRANASRARIAGHAFLLLLPILLLLLREGASAQEERPAVSLSGSATLSGDLYSSSSDPSGSEGPRRPPSLFRLLLNPTVTIGDLVSLPFSIMLTSRETNVTTPIANNPTLTQFLQNPANGIGLLSFSPKIAWAQLYLGTHTPQFSELSWGDEQLFGVGVDLRPGTFRFAASAGTSQRAIEPDSAAGIRGAYARRAYMIKVGFGNEETSFIDLNGVRVVDDSTSIMHAPAGVTPQEGLLASADFRIGIAHDLYITGEAAASAFTRDRTAPAINGDTPIPTALLDSRTSTRTDGAASLDVVAKGSFWGLKVGGKYIGAGYVPLGYPFMQSDRLEFRAAPSLTLFESALLLNGTIGFRTNNLTETKGTSSTQLTGSVNLLATLTDALSLTARFANLGVRNTVTNDTFKVQNVSRSFELSPTYTLALASSVQSFTLSFALDAYTDYNPVSGVEASNDTRSVTGLWVGTWTEMPLVLNASLNYLTNNLAVGSLAITSATFGVGYNFLQNRLTPSATASYTSTTFGGGSAADAGLLLRLGVQWTITERIALNAAFSTNGYRYDASRAGAVFRENLLETSLTTRF
ncbi:MAG TPA: hypothetical protein VHI13_14265 [Candidatus Kapabacteria bacterium]|nr:hypothetical protein [Candidatus Kapabacteria bacterium]